MKVGFIGLGNMGQAISGRIIDGGFDLTVYNRTRSKADELEQKGARVADSVAEACAGRDVVFTMLSDDKALNAVVDGGLLDNLPKGAIHVPMGTHSVTALLELKERHDAAGHRFVAAPVLGRPDAAASGQLGIVPGGDQEAIAELGPLWKAIGRRTFDAGSNPAGAAAVKLANNMVLGCAVEAMAEAFALTRKFDVEPVVFNEVMTDGLFAAPAYKVYGGIIANESYENVGFSVKLGFKDSNLVMAAGQAANVPLPSLNVFRDTLLEALANGEGDLDWAVMGRVRARAGGLE
ncbi:MAG: NAD(P)-dependent oxidoreductase [Gammaproteobacteria bacterium]|jgi:3-hydroxyisobutyrate dehydrogenase-like beta-hydroxyacid dehydrogenase